MGFLSPVSIAVERDGNLVVAAGDVFFGTLGFGPSVRLMRVDPHSGDRIIVSGDDTGSGPSIATAGAIAEEADGQPVVVNRGETNTSPSTIVPPSVVRVNPVSGDRIAVSSFTGSIPIFGGLDITVEADGQLVVYPAMDTWLSWIVY